MLTGVSGVTFCSASAFPDLDEPSEIEGEELPGDQTVVRPAGQGARDRTDQNVSADDATTQTTAQESSEARGRPNTQPKPGASRPAGKGEPSKAGSAEPDPEVDGDATVLVPPTQRPAGTDHISGQRRPPGSN